MRKTVQYYHRKNAVLFFYSSLGGGKFRASVYLLILVQIQTTLLQGNTYVHSINKYFL